jgi:hypothetical protein
MAGHRAGAEPVGARLREGVRRYAEAGPEAQRRAAFACAVGNAEDEFRSPWADGSVELRHVTELLQATGYALTQVELDRITPRAADGAAPGGNHEHQVACRVCGCTEDAACESGCEWVEDPLQGDLCSRCAEAAGFLDEDLRVAGCIHERSSAPGNDAAAGESVAAAEEVDHGTA